MLAALGGSLECVAAPWVGARGGKVEACFSSAMLKGQGGQL